MNKKNIMAFLGFLFVIFFIWLFSWGASQKRKCELALENSGEVILMYVESSREGISGNKSKCIYSIFSTVYKGERITANNNSFVEVLPIGLPAYFLYTTECEDCVELLLDSIIFTDGYKVEFFNVKNKGNSFKIIKVPACRKYDE